MGRLPYSDRITVEECRRLVIGREARQKLKELAQKGYRATCYNIASKFPDDEIVKYSIPFEIMQMPRGGIRYFLLCPLVKNGEACRRRVDVLYLPPGGRYFGCRQCYNLTYKCQKEHNKRWDLYKKNPGLLLNLIGSKKASDLLLAINLYTENIEKLMSLK